jgi:hypothetical protein
MPIQPAAREWFLHDYQQFWHTGAGEQLLAALRGSACQNCSAVRGWTKGGCLVAARGIQRYITASVEAGAASLCVSLAAVATDETEAAHVLVALCNDGEERFLDATGFWTREALLSRLSIEYLYDAYELVPWEAVPRDQVRIPFDGHIAQLVAEALRATFGRFSPDWIFSTPPLAPVAVDHGRRAFQPA